MADRKNTNVQTQLFESEKYVLIDQAFKGMKSDVHSRPFTMKQPQKMYS
jgi:hypothetical protein